MEPLTFEEIARERKEVQIVAGRSSDARLVNVIERASERSGLLAWTLTGVIRIAGQLGEESEVLSQLAEELQPYVESFKMWLPWHIAPIFAEALVDRDSAIRLVRAANLETGDVEDLLEWLSMNEDAAPTLIGEPAARRLVEVAESRGSAQTDDEFPF